MLENLKMVFKLEDPSIHYEILKKIGVGGTSKVYLMKRNLDGFECALKLVSGKIDWQR